MDRFKIYSAVLIVLSAVLSAAVVSIPGVGHTDQPQWHPAKNISFDDPAEVRRKVSLRGKTKGSTHPAEAVFGQIFVNTQDGSEWIFDGEQWVPHDNTVDAYYEYLKTIDKTPPGQECKKAYPQDNKGGAK